MIKIEKVSLTKENLLKIKKVDDSFYKEDLLTLEWYIERYNENNNGFLLMNDDCCVGYLVSVPIKKELYKAIINGVLINDLYINPNMIVNKSKYQYIVSSVILDNYRHKGYGKEMMKELLKNEKKVFCALTITKDGYNLAKKFMKLKLKINDDTNVFVLNK